MKRLLKLALLVAALCAACEAGHHPAPAPTWQEAISSAKRVLAYRVSGDTVLTTDTLRKHLSSGAAGLPKLDEGKYVQGYPILLGPVQVPRRVRQELPRIVIDRRSYGHRGVDAWSPAVAFRFYGKNRVIEVLVSYRDGGMGIYEHGEPVYYAPICPVQNELIQLVDSFLPRATM